MAKLLQLDSTHCFVSEQFQKGTQVLSMGDLVDLWEIKNLPDGKLDENVAAIQVSVDDMLECETGQDAFASFADHCEQTR